MDVLHVYVRYFIKYATLISLRMSVKRREIKNSKFDKKYFFIKKLIRKRKNRKEF